MREHLGQIQFEKKPPIDVYRDDDKSVIFSQEGHDIVLRKASGRVTMEITAMLEGLGGKVEEPDD